MRDAFSAIKSVLGPLLLVLQTCQTMAPCRRLILRVRYHSVYWVPATGLQFTKNSGMINDSHGYRGPLKIPQKQPPGCGESGIYAATLLGMTGSYGASNYRWIPKKEWWCSTDELTHQGLQQFTNPMGVWGMNPSSLAPIESNRSKPTVGLLSPICL